MAQAKQENSLTSDFRALATPAEKAARKELQVAKKARNAQNQAAIGQWHNESRGKNTEVPFPARRTH